jgi:catechol 2,3-dioxygenase-like lactoylglutathione lyase family enzyme
MIDHVSSYATDFEETKRFYDAVLPGLGYACVMEMVASWDADFPERRMVAYGEGGKPVFWVIEVRDAATPRHVAFRAASRRDVDGFHAAALQAGAPDNGVPGLRPQYHENYYGAFALDPDGNNVEAVRGQPE